MRRVVAIAGALAAVAAGAVLSGASDGAEGQRYRILFDSAFGVVEGADFKISGVRAGSVESFDLSEGFPPLAVIEAVVENEGVRPLRADAFCEVKPQSLIGEYFVDCQPGNADELLPGRTVPVEQTAGTIPLDLVNNIMREPQRDRLPLILNALGAGLAGRSEDIEVVLERAHPALRETNQVLEILARQDDVIERFIADSDTVIAALERRKRDVVRFVDEAEDAARVSATRRGELARTFDLLPTFLAELRPTMARLEEVAEAQVPTLRELREAAPELLRAFEELEPFADESRPALLSLGELADTGLAAIRESGNEIDELRRLAEDAPELGTPLRQFLETLDDRSRAIEPDPRAAETAPPQPDPTADNPGRGFTGFESLLNYFYWQTLSINIFDEVSHVLRVNPIIDECSPYSVNPVEEDRTHCVSWLGPVQPGVTAPDPTEGGDPPVQDQPAAEQPAARDGGDRPAARAEGGSPQERAAPRRSGLASPQVVLPEGVEQLVEGLGRLVERQDAPLRRRQPPASEPESRRLLDFLLGP